jgi:hypothetical protein
MRLDGRAVRMLGLGGAWAFLMFNEEIKDVKVKHPDDPTRMVTNPLQLDYPENRINRWNPSLIPLLN